MHLDTVTLPRLIFLQVGQKSWYRLGCFAHSTFLYNLHSIVAPHFGHGDKGKLIFSILCLLFLLGLMSSATVKNVTSPTYARARKNT